MKKNVEQTQAETVKTIAEKIEELKASRKATNDFCAKCVDLAYWVSETMSDLGIHKLSIKGAVINCYTRTSDSGMSVDILDATIFGADAYGMNIETGDLLELCYTGGTYYAYGDFDLAVKSPTRLDFKKFAELSTLIVDALLAKLAETESLL